MQEWPLTPTDLSKVEEGQWGIHSPNIITFNYMAGSENTSKSAIFVPMKILRIAESPINKGKCKPPNLPTSQITIS